MSCEKEPVVPVEPPVIKPVAPLIFFEGISPLKPEIEYGQGVKFKAKTHAPSKITYNGYTGEVSESVEISLKEMVRDTTFTFIATSKEGLSTTYSLNIKVPEPDPFFLKMIGVWRQTGKDEIYDFPGGDRSKPMEWKTTLNDTNNCVFSRREAFTLDKKLIHIHASGCFLISPVGISPWTKITKEEKLGIEMYYIHHEAAKGNEAGGAYEYRYFKGDTLIMYQEIRLDPLITAFRSFKSHFVLETKDYKAYIKNAEDTYTPASIPSSGINPNFSVRMISNGNMVMLK